MSVTNNFYMFKVVFWPHSWRYRRKIVEKQDKSYENSFKSSVHIALKICTQPFYISCKNCRSWELNTQYWAHRCIFCVSLVVKYISWDKSRLINPHSSIDKMLNKCMTDILQRRCISSNWIVVATMVSVTTTTMKSTPVVTQTSTTQPILMHCYYYYY